MSAVLSPCGDYRYRLEREIAVLPGFRPTALVIMINPSTADAVEDDHTIRKLKGFAAQYGWTRLMVGNLFAYRTKDVRQLKLVGDPVGRDNDRHLMQMIREADRIVVAWGPLTKQPAKLRGRFRKIVEMALYANKALYSIGPTAADGHPKHPLMLPYSLELQPWTDPRQ